MSTPEPSVAVLDSSDSQKELASFWLKVNQDIQNATAAEFKTQELPLARIKKIMKLDEDVKMISAEAPLLFSKAAEIFISELTLRAWIHTEDNKRRTLQRNDIAMAITKFDMFDFLIDIVPREEIKPGRSETKTPVMSDQVQYYLQLAQQNQQALQSTATTAPQTIQIVQPGGQVQTISVVPAQPAQTLIQTPSAGGSQHQIVQLQAQGGAVNQMVQHAASATATSSGASNGASGIQIVQQVIGPNGEIQQVPVQLTPQQHQAIRMQLGSLVQGQQQVILQTGGQQGSTGPQQTQVIQVQQLE